MRLSGNVTVASTDSHGLTLSYRVLLTPGRRTSLATAASSCGSIRPAPPMRFFAPSASPRTWQLHDDAVCLTASHAPSGFLDLSALCRHVPAGLVSCQIRSWGSTLQSFVPLTWPYAVSGAVPLVTFAHLLDPTGRFTFAPPPKQRRVCKSDSSTMVGRHRSTAPPRTTPVAWHRARCAEAHRTRCVRHTGQCRRCRAIAEAPARRRLHRPGAARASRTQALVIPDGKRHSPLPRHCRNSVALKNERPWSPGSVLAFKGLLPVRIRAPATGGLDRPQVRSSPGLHTLQGFLPRPGGTALSTVPPLMGFRSSVRRPRS